MKPDGPGRALPRRGFLRAAAVGGAASAWTVREAPHPHLESDEGRSDAEMLLLRYGGELGGSKQPGERLERAGEEGRVRWLSSR